MPTQKTQEGWTRIKIILQPDHRTLVLRNVHSDKARILSIIQRCGEELLPWGEGADCPVTSSGSGVTATYRGHSDQEPISQLQVGLTGEVSYIVRSPAVLPATGLIKFDQLTQGYLLRVLAFGGELYREYKVNNMIHCAATFDEITLRTNAFPSQSICEEAKRREICEELMPQVRTVIAAWEKA